MPDITMCSNNSCPLRKDCWRNPASGTLPADLRQAYSHFAPKLAGLNGQKVQFCQFFWPAGAGFEQPDAPTETDALRAALEAITRGRCAPSSGDMNPMETELLAIKSIASAALREAAETDGKVVS